MNGSASKRALEPTLLPLDLPPVQIPRSAATLSGFRAWVSSAAIPEHCQFTFAAKTLILCSQEMSLFIPVTALTLDGFRAWAWSSKFPRHGRISLFPRDMVINMSPEELETHNLVKTEVLRVLGNINVETDLGKLYSDRTLLTNEEVELSTEPDGLFASWESIESQQVQLKPRRRRRGQYTEVQGTPDWVLEVVSDDSVRKDNEELRDLYHRAGIPEYWIIDARGDEVLFRILLHRKKGYIAARQRKGWAKSAVFDRSFRLQRRNDRLGMWQYLLEEETD